MKGISASGYQSAEYQDIRRSGKSSAEERREDRLLDLVCWYPGILRADPLVC